MKMKKYRTYSCLLLISLCLNLDLRAQNKSIKLNGGNHFITVNNSGLASPLDFTIDTFTIEAWISPNSFASSSNNYEHTIVGKDSSAVSGGGYVLRTGGSRKVEFSYNYGGGWNSLASNNAMLSSGRWTHIAVSKINGTISIYVNGVMVRDSTFATNMNISSTSVPLRIGENGSSNNRKFIGRIDEVKIWKSLRSVNQIKNDMMESCPTYNSDLLSYYKLNDTSSLIPSTIICATDTAYNGIMNDSIDSEIGSPLLNGFGILYVDSSHSFQGCNEGTGNSWNTAFTTLDKALRLAHEYPFIEEVHIAQGTYVANSYRYVMQTDGTGVMQSLNNNKSKLFHIRMGLEVYGGYISGGGLTRNPYLYHTILDGAGVGNIATDTAYHVVYIDNSPNWSSVNDTTILDGIIARNSISSTNSNAINYGTTGRGGVVFIMDGLNKVNRCIIENGYGYNNTAGLYIRGGYNYIFHSKIQNNRNGRGLHSDFGQYLGAQFFDHDTVLNSIDGGGIRIRSNTRITNCLIQNNYVNNDGAGLHVRSHNNVILNNTFLNNRVGTNPNFGEGGAIYLHQTNNDTVSNNTFIGNTAGYAGGGLYVYGGFNHYFKNNIFQQDSASIGGGIYSFNTNTIWRDNLFEQNYASSTGGGAHVNNGSNYFVNNVFDNNYAQVSGGGLRNHQGTDTLVNNSIVNNHANEYGGGAYITNANVRIYNNNISNNFGAYSGGLALYSNPDSAEITNNTFYNNQADSTVLVGSQVAGGLFFSGHVVKVSNNIFWGNNINGDTATLGADYARWVGSPIFRSNLLQLNGLSSYSSSGAGGNTLGIGATNNIFNSIPQFVNKFNLNGNDNIYNTSDDGLNISNTSPCIDAGVDSLLPGFLTMDIANNPRISNSNIDIGAYELYCAPINITSNSALDICIGNNTTLSVSSSSIASNISWYSDSISTSALGTGYSYNTPVLFNTDTFWVQSNACFNNARVPIIVNVNNTASTITNTTVMNQLLICSGSSANLSVASSAISDSIYWYTDSFSVSHIDTGFTYSTPALVSKDTFWVSAHGCVNSSRIPIVIDIFPPTGTNASVSNCNSYFWAVNNTTYTNSGTYYDTSLNSNNCIQYDTLNLTILPSSSSTTSTSACDNYLWPLNNQTYFTSGIYFDTLTNSIGCDSIVSLNLTINSTNAVITKSGIQLTATITGATYQWIECIPFQIISGATSQTYTPLSNGNYAVIITQNNCTDTSSCTNITGVGLEEITNSSGIYVSPNPSKSVFNIQFDKQVEEVIFSVNDIAGNQLILNKKNNIKNYSLNLSEFSKGIYFLKLILEDKIYYVKLSKE